MRRKEENFEKLYNYLLESGEIRGLKKYSGIWEKDKNKFIQAQTELEDLANIQEYDETE